MNRGAAKICSDFLNVKMFAFLLKLKTEKSKRMWLVVKMYGLNQIPKNQPKKALSCERLPHRDMTVRRSADKIWNWKLQTRVIAAEDRGLLVVAWWGPATSAPCHLCSIKQPGTDFGSTIISTAVRSTCVRTDGRTDGRNALKNNRIIRGVRGPRPQRYHNQVYLSRTVTDAPPRRGSQECCWRPSAIRPFA